MQATNQIKKRSKLSTIIQNIVNAPKQTITSSYQTVITIFNNNTPFQRPSNLFQETIKPILQHFDEEVTQLIKEKKNASTAKKITYNI